MKDFFLADDLSGALDAAAAFHRSGWRVRISLSPDNWSETVQGEMVGFTTETRNVAPGEAARIVTRVVSQARAAGGRLWFKKIDSTMRGPVATEISALMDVLPEIRVLFTPANPHFGRTVRGGILRVNGVPVSETAFGRDPVSPVCNSSLRTLLGDINGDRIVVADAETEADLTAAVARMDGAGGNWVGVGSGALAQAVAKRMVFPVEARRILPSETQGGPTLFVCGSGHDLNRIQAENLRRERGVPVHELRVREPAAAAKQTVASLGRGGSAALVLESVRTESGAALRAISSAAVEAIRVAGVRRVFITGGETAFAVCTALKISSLVYLAEIEAGVALSSGEADQGGMLLAVKPGGFGGPATWVRAWDRLQAEA